MPESLQINFAAQRFNLLADRCLHWIEQNSLVLADVHLGKDAVFRAAGLSVPAGNSKKDLARIQKLLLATKANRLVILGDLVHGRASHQPELSRLFTDWRRSHPKLDILLIRGNHDRHAGPPPAEWNITQEPEPFDAGPLILSHFPREAAKPVLCGHVHPTVSLRDYDGTSVAIPCFVADPNQLLLPAFGSFTGGHKIHPGPDCKIYPTFGHTIAVSPQKERG